MRKPLSAFRRLTRAAAPLALLMLGSCTAVQLSYNNADIAIRYKVQSYFGLQGEQQAEFEARLRRFHAWHRDQELPRYAALARTASDRVADGITAEDIDWASAALRARYRFLVREVAQQAAPVLATLTPAQIDRLENEFADSNRKFARKYLSGGEQNQLQDRIDRAQERFEQWLGALTDAQAAAIESMVRSSPSLSAHRLEERKQNQQRFVRLLRGSPTALELTTALEDLLANVEAQRPPNYAAAMREAEPRFADLLLDLDRTFTPAQREHVRQRLVGYAKDFQELAVRRQDKGRKASAATNRG